MLCYLYFFQYVIVFTLDIINMPSFFTLVEHTSHHQLLQEPGDYTDAPLSKRNY